MNVNLESRRADLACDVLLILDMGTVGYVNSKVVGRRTSKNGLE